MTGGRSSKQKGSRNERSLVRQLVEAGFQAERSPLSGALRSEKYGGGCDVEVTMFGRKHRIEAKHHANGFARLYTWLDGVDFLVVRANRSEPLVVMPLSRLIEIAKAHIDTSDIPETSEEFFQKAKLINPHDHQSIGSRAAKAATRKSRGRKDGQ